MCQFSTTTWSGFDFAVDRQNYLTIVKSSQKFEASDVMLGIHSLMIWTICHKLISFYRNAVSFHITFVVTHGEIFSHLGHTGPLTVNKNMALPSRYRRIWRHIHAFIGRNTIALRVQRFAAGANLICLTRHRLMSCHWSCDPRRVKISGHSVVGAARTMCFASWLVNTWVDSVCVSVHYSFVIDGQNSNRI